MKLFFKTICLWFSTKRSLIQDIRQLERLVDIEGARVWLNRRIIRRLEKQNRELQEKISGYESRRPDNCRNRYV